MKLAFYDDYVPGRVEGDEIVDLSTIAGDAIMALPPHDRPAALFAAFAGRVHELAAGKGLRRRLGEIALRAPVPRPTKMLFAIGNYPEGEQSPKSRLNLALKSPTSILDPDGLVLLPERDARVFHAEPELAVVMGRAARNVSEADALAHVFGYTAVLDVNARGLGYGIGVDSNSFDTFCPMGPWITTADDMVDPQQLGVEHRLRDATLARYATADMEHPVRELIAWASSVGTLEVGDIIACGSSHQQLVALQGDDRIEVEIGGIGTLRASAHDPLGRRWPTGIDAGLAEAARKARKAGTVLNIKEASMARLEEVQS